MPSPMTSTMLPEVQEELESFTKWQVETIDIIGEMSRSLGWDFDIAEIPLQIKDKDGNIAKTIKRELRVTKLVENPSINRDGVLDIIQHFFSILNKNTILANLEKAEVQELFFNHNMATLTMLTQKFDLYGIKDLSTLDKVQNASEKLSLAVLSRGRGGATMEYLQPILKYIEGMAGQKKNEGGVLG